MRRPKEVPKPDPELPEGHWKTHKVETDAWGECDELAILYTDGLGPCIGVCIAYNGWAAIVHESSIDLTETGHLAQMVAAARRRIPKKLWREVRPVVVGADTAPGEDDEHDPDDYEQGILETRKRVVAYLTKTGFGKPRVYWNGYGETGGIVADSHAQLVKVEMDGAVVAKCRIVQPPARRSTPRGAK